MFESIHRSNIDVKGRQNGTKEKNINSKKDEKHMKHKEYENTAFPFFTIIIQLFSTNIDS